MQIGPEGHAAYRAKTNLGLGRRPAGAAAS
jgi:hypothetical protein